MEYIGTEEPLAVAAVKAIHTGDTSALRQLLAEHPGLAIVRLGDRGGISRTLLHVVTDWPGHFPNGPATVAALVEAGADVNARFTGPHTETSLHWAASSNDVAVIDALLDAGADLEAPGAVIGGGAPLADARGFGQWQAAYRLVERGARTRLKRCRDAWAHGLCHRILRSHCTSDTRRSDGGVLGRVSRRAAAGCRIPAQSRRRYQLDRPRQEGAARHRSRKRRRRADRRLRSRAVAACPRREVGRGVTLTVSRERRCSHLEANE